MTAPVAEQSVPDIVQMMHDNGDGTALMITWAPPTVILSVVERFLKHMCGEPHASALIPLDTVHQVNETYAATMVLHVRDDT